jgi:hypothetical protein
MSYCTVADVQAEFKAVTFTTISLVTSATVGQFILEAGALIDSYVGQRWVTPVTGDATSLALMSLFSRTLVADRVRGILANKQQTNTDANQAAKGDGYSVKNVMQALVAIKNGEMQLPGATLLLESGGFFSNNYDQSINPSMKKGVKQW